MTEQHADAVDRCRTPHAAQWLAHAAPGRTPVGGDGCTILPQYLLWWGTVYYIEERQTMTNYDDLTDDYDLSEGDVLKVTLRSVDGDELETELEVSSQGSYAEHGIKQDDNHVGTLVIRNGTPMLFRDGREDDVAYIQRSGDTTHWVEEMEVA